MLRLQRENDDLAEELVSSKVALRVDMDSVSDMMHGHHTECVFPRDGLYYPSCLH